MGFSLKQNKNPITPGSVCGERVSAVDFLGGEGTEWEGRGDGGAGPGGGGTPAEARGVSTAFPTEPVTAALRPADLTLARAGGVGGAQESGKTGRARPRWG